MHNANHIYGHSNILARYAGLGFDDPPRMWGYLQHGWNILDGFPVELEFRYPAPKFVWSDGPRWRGWSMGRRGYFVVGSPWAYLLKLEPDLGRVDDDSRQGTIFYPFHGWEGQQIFGSHQRLIEQIHEVESGPVTVCLYWIEYRIKQLRDLYSDAGFRVISHGHRR